MLIFVVCTPSAIKYEFFIHFSAAFRLFSCARILKLREICKFFVLFVAFSVVKVFLYASALFLHIHIF